MNALQTSLWISLGAMVGANTRFWLGRWITTVLPSHFPLATLLINVTGSLLLGSLVVVPETQTRSGYLLLGVGFCGAYTTFSTFSVETLRLWQTGHTVSAIVYAAFSPVASIAAAWIGYSLVNMQ